MRFVFVAARKDLRRRLSDPAALVIWIGVPLLLAGLMNLVAGGGETVPRAKVLIADQDNTIVSRFLASSGGRGGLGNMVDLEDVSLEEGQRRIDAGEATALVVLPKGFQESVLRDAPAQVVLVTNPAQRILPGIVEEALEILVEGVFYAQRLFGPIIDRIATGTSSSGPSDADVASISVAINERLRRLQNVVIPPAIRLDVKTDEPQAGPGLNFGQLFLPGLLFMSFLFIAQGMSADVWAEKRLGTLRRVLTTPQSAYRLLAGKLAAGVALSAAIALVALLASVALFGIAWTRVPLAIVWCTFAGGALIALMTLIQTLATSERGGNMLSSIVVLPLMMIGGSFFPFETMPAWMAAIGRWTPNGLAVVRLKDLLYGDPSAVPLLIAAIGIGVPAAAAFALAGRRLRGRFATS